MGIADAGSVHVGAGLPGHYHAPAAEAAALARDAEQLGYDSIWLPDPSLGYGGSLEPVTLLAYLAAATERAALGIAVILLPRRVPVQLAQMLATIDQVSNGRVIVGIGRGRNDASQAAYGVAPAGILARYEEAIAVLRAAWGPDPVVHHGEAWTIDRIAVQPKPMQAQLPIWFGGSADAAIDRAARLGDGWIGAGSAPWADTPALLETVYAALDRHQRDPATFAVGKRVYFAVEPDRSRALPRMRDAFGVVYGRPDLADRVAISGTAEHVLEELGRLVERGCRFLLLDPAYDHSEQLAIAAEQLLPTLRQLSGPTP